MLKTASSITNAIGALNYKGTWDAATNNPTLTSSVGTQGDYYVVSVAGSTNLNGTTLWGVGDMAIFNGSIWQKADGGDTSLVTGLTVMPITPHLLPHLQPFLLPTSLALYPTQSMYLLAQACLVVVRSQVTSHSTLPTPL